MTVFSVDIDDKLVKQVGEKNVNEFMERQVNYLRLKYFGNKIAEAFKESDFDQEKEFEKARQEAWDELKEEKSKKNS